MITVVAMSGGVDSSSAAWLLKNSIKLKKEFPDNNILAITHWWNELEQSSPDLQKRAMAVCDKIGIPYSIIDMENLFNKLIIKDFSNCYLNGETPNPCVRCNERIRFSAFYNSCYNAVSEKYNTHYEDYHFCTGHYVRTENIKGKIFLKKAIDHSKDQSYMLYRIPSKVLSHCIFPLGSYTKEEIKQIANKQGFFGKSIEESQDICFIRDNYISFLRRTLNPKMSDLIDRPGKIIDKEGNFLGNSRGYLHYTIGQRKGLGLGNGPWYVDSIDAKNNLVTVGRMDELGVSEFYIKETNWFIELSVIGEAKPLKCDVQLRYNSKEYECQVFKINRERFLIKLEKNAIASPGQSAVFYNGDILLGGGIICRD